MIVRRRARPPAPSGAVRFDERLSVPWWWWMVAAAAVGLVVISVRLGHPGVPGWVPAVITAALLATALVRAGKARVTLTEDGDGSRLLRVGAAVLAARFVAEASVVAPTDKQRTLGPELDPDAFVVHRPWIGPLVRVRLDDPGDPTPYWLFSVRHPEALLVHLAPARPV